MPWIVAFRSFTTDSVRQAQFYMVCRQLGMILSSIVIARFLPVRSVGNMEMLMLCGYLMTFFWSEALLRGYLATPNLQNDRSSISSFVLLYFLGGLASMVLLVAGQRFLIPLFTSRQNLEGLEFFVLYQVLIIPVWISPFIGLLKGQNTVLLSLYVLIGPSFACWTGFTGYPGIMGALLGLFSYALVGFIWMLTKSQMIRNLRLKSILKAIWPATWPLVLYAVSTGIARSFDAWLVARHFDEEAFAIFRYGAREFPLVIALAAGLSTVMIPRLRDFTSLEELKLRSNRLMHMCYPIVAVFLLSSPLLFPFVFGIEYKASGFIFNIYLLLTLTQLVFPQTILTAREDTRWLWYFSVVELIVNVIASLVLMKYFGLAGIAWGTLIAFAFEKVALILVIRSRYGIRLSEIISIPVWMFYISLLTISFIAAQWIFGA